MALAGVVALLPRPAAGALLLAEGGRAHAAIVIPDEPTDGERGAAKELAHYLGQVTGAAFETFKEGEPTGEAVRILIGATKAARQAGLIRGGEEAWVVKTDGRRLFLTGGVPRGAPYATLHFLEDVVGVHWWTQWEETVPRKERLEVGDLHLRGEPDIFFREVRGNVTPPMPARYFFRNRMHTSVKAWKEIAREYGGTRGYGLPFQVHTYNMYLPPSVHFAEHPEWYSLIDGRRVSEKTQLCLTNPEVFREMEKRLRGYIDATCEAYGSAAAAPKFFSISPNDWRNPCQCERCQAVVEKEGAQTALVHGFANRLAAAIEKDHPDVFIDTLAYMYYRDIPKTVHPRENVIVRLCTQNANIARPLTDPSNGNFQEWLKQWSAVAPNLHLWEYCVSYGPDCVLPAFHARDAVASWRWLEETGVDGAFLEYEYPVVGPYRDLNLWVLAKAFENLDIDLDETIETFCLGYYGPAAGPLVKDVYDRLHRSLERNPSRVVWRGDPFGYNHLTFDFLVRAENRMAEAERLVADDPDLLRRVRHARLPIDAAIVYRWGPLMQKEAKAGEASPTLPFDRVAAARRALETIETMKRIRYAGFDERRLEWTLVRIDAVEDTLRRLSEHEVTVAPLPEELRGVSDRAIVFSADALGLRPLPSTSLAQLVDDEASPTGRAVAFVLKDIQDPQKRAKFLMSDPSPFVFGLYDYVRKRGLASKRVTPGDVPGAGYHLYALENVALTPSAYLYLSWSWNVQVQVGSAAMANPDATFDVYVSARFDGPSFPYGAPQAPDAIYVDRVIVVPREAP